MQTASGHRRARVSESPVDPVRGLGYRADVDGLRGISVLLVLLYHAGVPWARGGYGGVDIFFVISGYLIGFQVFRELRDERFALWPFYEKRVRRILPALLVVVMSCLAAGWIILDARELSSLGEQAAAASTFFSNVYYWRAASYFAPSSRLQPLLMTWSLGIEGQFYVLFPLVAVASHRWLKQKSWILFALLLLGSLASATAGMHHGQHGAFYLLPGRWWELAAGVTLGSIEVRSASGPILVRGRAAELCAILGLVGVVASATLPEPNATFAVPPTVIPVASAVLLCLSAASWVNRRVLAFPALSGLGRRSYSLYLWHWPLLSLGRICGADHLTPWATSALLLAGLLLAEITYRYVELPFRRPKSKTTARRIIAGVELLTLAAAAALILAKGLPARNPSAIAVEAETTIQTMGRECLVHSGDSVANLPGKCISSSAYAALLGDSHAAAIAQGLPDAGSGIGLMMKSSCPPLLDVTLRGAGPDVCSVFMRNAVDRAVNEKNIHTVILAGFWLDPMHNTATGSRYVRTERFTAPTTDEQSWANLRAGFFAITQRLVGAGKHVVLVDDVPVLRHDPHLLAIDRTIPPRAKLGSWLAAVSQVTEHEEHPRTRDEVRMRALLDDAATNSGSRVVSLYDSLCDGTTCRVLEGGLPLFEDRHHLTPRGAHAVILASGLEAAAR